MKNWFGKHPHPTDELIHWQTKNIDEVYPSIRQDYNLIGSLGPMYEAALKRLLDRARETGALDEADNNNPDL